MHCSSLGLCHLIYPHLGSFWTLCHLTWGHTQHILMTPKQVCLRWLSWKDSHARHVFPNLQEALNTDAKLRPDLSPCPPPHVCSQHLAPSMHPSSKLYGWSPLLTIPSKWLWTPILPGIRGRSHHSHLCHRRNASTGLLLWSCHSLSRHQSILCSFYGHSPCPPPCQDCVLLQDSGQTPWHGLQSSSHSVLV